MDTAQKKIHLKWVRSGIGFDRSQSEVVRSLGLRRLNHVVERSDTPQVRGLVAKVAHLVEIVRDVQEPVWSSTQAYTIKAAPPEQAPTREETKVPASLPAEAGATPLPGPDPLPEDGASASAPAAVPTVSSQSPAVEKTSSQNDPGEKE